MGENSQLKPESCVILKKSLSISLQKSGFEKKSLSLKILKKSLCIGREKFGLKKSRKKSQYRS